MWVIDALKDALSTAGRVIASAAKVQGQARRELKDDLQRICSKCDAAYSAVLSRLAPVKNSYGDTAKLASELRAMAADQQTRNAFMPQHLCGETDALLMKLNDNLDRQVLQTMASCELIVLRRNSTSTPPSNERIQYVREVIEDFETSLLEAIKQVREAKCKVLASV